MTISVGIAAFLSILIAAAGAIILLGINVILDEMRGMVGGRLLGLLGLAVGLGLFLVGFNLWCSATAPGAESVEVVETRGIASFEGIEGGEYMVIEDARGDGGLSKKTYPSDKTLVYEDAAPEEARVEVVEIKKLAGGTFFGIPVTGAVDTDEEYRIHVPKGSLKMAGL